MSPLNPRTPSSRYLPAESLLTLPRATPAPPLLPHRQRSVEQLPGALHLPLAPPGAPCLLHPPRFPLLHQEPLEHPTSILLPAAMARLLGPLPTRWFNPSRLELRRGGAMDASVASCASRSSSSSSLDGMNAPAFSAASARLDQGQGYTCIVFFRGRKIQIRDHHSCEEKPGIN